MPSLPPPTWTFLYFLLPGKFITALSVLSFILKPPPNSMLDFKIPEDEFPRVSSQTQGLGRRVVLHDLAPNCTLAQIAESIQYYPYVQLGIFDTSKIPNSGVKGGYIEFLTSDSAFEFHHLVKNGLVIYMDGTGQAYAPQADLPRGPAIGGATLEMLRARWTHIFKAEQFPREAVWFFLNAYGLHNIVKAVYDEERQTLRVAFRSIFLAGVTLQSVIRGFFPYFRPQFTGAMGNRIWQRDFAEAMQSNDRPPSVGFDFDSLSERQSTTFAGVSPSFLADEFNRSPYNAAWPSTYHRIMSAQGLRPHLSQEEKERHMSLQIENEVELSHKKWSWQTHRPHRSADAQAAFLKRTLNDREWEAAWGRFFSANAATTANLLRFEKYAAVARHRRETPPGQCDGTCGFGCHEMKAAPSDGENKEGLWL